MDADKQQIAEVLIRYATGIDSKDWPVLRSCFTDEIDVDYQQLGRFTSPRRAVRLAVASKLIA